MNIFARKPAPTFDEQVATALTAGDAPELARLFGLDEARAGWWAGLCFTKAAAVDDGPQARAEAKAWLERRGLPLPANCITD